MERNEGHLVVDSSVARAVVLVVAMLTATGADIVASQPASQYDNGINKLPDVARIEPNVETEVVLFDTGVL